MKEEQVGDPTQVPALYRMTKERFKKKRELLLNVQFTEDFFGKIYGPD